jgi:catechol 2,3-dioxygenase-like lactoylglutathione lyase family enzyme
MIKGVAHVAMASADPHKLADWYISNLDFTLFSRSETAVFIQAPNDVLFEIILADKQLQLPGMKDAGLRHIAIAVDDFEEAYLRLKNSGVSFESEPYKASGNTVVFFKDPDGNFLHLIYPLPPLFGKRSVIAA